jgi:outer membrane protein OmpA-like peptidoglycan-associated protein
MQRHGRQFLFLAASLGLLVSGCATKKFVRYEIAQLTPKFTELGNQIMETNEKVDAVDRRAQQGIAAADQKATVAGQAAANAAQAATVADGKAVAADAKADRANQGVQQANAQITSLDNRTDTRFSRLERDAYSIGDPQVIVFKTDSADLSDEAKQALDTVAGSVASEQSRYLIEIHGFTDTTGAENYNVDLSQRRADSALRYLVGKGVPVFRTSVVGLGEEAPVADNESKEGRQQNRRVEVRILRLAGGRTAN